MNSLDINVDRTRAQGVSSSADRTLSPMPAGSTAPGAVVASARRIAGAALPGFARELGERYEIRGQLGEGAFGIVFLAWDRLMGREVAIKTLKELRGDLVMRFRREAELLARLAHPNILRVFDRQLDGDPPYMITERVDGETLADHLRSVRLELDHALALCAQVGDAVAYGHSHGILHRDIKPSNVFVLREGGVKLGDFGLAREIAAGTTLTRCGVLVGTPLYLSPEMVCGKRATPESDQYALGVMAYQMVTGTPPFTGDSVENILGARLLDDPKPPRAVNPELPPDVDALIMKALARKPADRFASVEAFSAAARATAGVPAGPLSPLASASIESEATLSPGACLGQSGSEL